MYKIKVNYNNCGEFIICDYDIKKEFDETFAIYDTKYCVSNNNVK
jgi:hypothetical protein